MITPQSIQLIEEFAMYKRLGGISLNTLSARKVDAFLVLENECRAVADTSMTERRQSSFKRNS